MPMSKRTWLFQVTFCWAAVSCVPARTNADVAPGSHSDRAPAAIVEWSRRFDYSRALRDFCPSQAASFGERSFVVGTGDEDGKEIRAFDKADPLWALTFEARVLGLVAIDEKTLLVLEGSRPPVLHRVIDGNVNASRPVTEFNEDDRHTASLDHDGSFLLRDERAYIYHEPVTGPPWDRRLLQSPSTAVTLKDRLIAIMGCPSVRSGTDCANLTVFDSSGSVTWDFSWSHEQIAVAELIYVNALRLSTERGIWLTGAARRPGTDDGIDHAYVAYVQAPGKFGWQSYVRSDGHSLARPIVSNAAFAATVLHLESPGSLHTSGRPELELKAGDTVVEYGPQGMRTHFLSPGLARVLGPLPEGAYLVTIRRHEECWLQSIRFL